MLIKHTMKFIVVLTVVVLVAVSSGNCGPHSGEDGGERKHDKFKKKFECMKQTHELKACCPLPKSSEDYKNDPECGHHLAEMDDKEIKDKFHAVVCFAECMFTSRGILSEDKEILWDEIKKQSNELLGESEEFQAVTERAIEFCETQCKKKIKLN